LKVHIRLSLVLDPVQLHETAFPTVESFDVIISKLAFIEHAGYQVFKEPLNSHAESAIL